MEITITRTIVAGWTARDEALTEREMELAELEDKVAGFEAEMDKAVATAKEQGRNIAKKKARNEAALAEKERKGQLDAGNLRIQELETQIAQNEARLTALNKELAMTRRQAQELAVKAIEGAATEQSLSAIREIAMEQAKTGGKVK